MVLAESQARRRQILAGIVIALGCWILLSAAYLSGLFHSFDQTLLDLRYRVRGERPASASIALVAIDDATLRAYGGWPIPRDQYAVLFTAIAEAGAEATGVDLQFPSDRNQDPKSNALLAYVASQQERLVVATWFHANTDAAGGAPAPDLDVLAALQDQGVPADEIVTAEAAAVALPYTELALSARQMGHITVAADRDGAIRRLPVIVRYRDRLYAALAMRVAGAARGLTGPPEVRSSGSKLIVGWRGGPRWRLPMDGDGTTSIDFAGDRASFTHAYSMLDVLRWYRDGEVPRLRSAFAGRLVLIGLDSRKEVTEDVGTTPFSEATSLLFVHANLLDNILKGRFLSRPPGFVYLAALGLLAILLGWVFAVRSLGAAAMIAAAVTLAIAAVDLAFLAFLAVDVPPMAALLLAPACYGSLASFRFVFLERRAWQREQEIREGRSVQQQFLPEAIVGQSLSRYRIMELLGAGGMGVVYRGRDERLGRDVAVKVLRGRGLADEQARHRFRNEARLLSRLIHPHIAGIYDFDTQDGADFIVMEYVRGPSLAARIRRGPIPEPEAAAIAVQIAEALAEAHRRRIVHRDLKPENVIFDDHGQVKVLDFGLARIHYDGGGLSMATTATSVFQSVTEEGTILGTLPYMAPETLRGEKAGPAGDIYALGVILFEMLTGHRPFPDDTPHELIYTVLNQPPPALRVVNARVSEAMDRIVQSALEKDPALRTASVEAMIRALTPLMAVGAPRQQDADTEVPSI